MDLMIEADIARMLKVTRQAVMSWRERQKTTGFPDPVMVRGRHRVYSREVVLEWHRNRAVNTGGRPLKKEEKSNAEL